MSALTWFRFARKVVGLSANHGYPNLEKLLEAEEGQPHYDYRVIKLIVPGIVVATGLGLIVSGLLDTSPILCSVGLCLFALAGATWLGFNQLDKAITPTKARLRKNAEQIWTRYRRLSNVVGVDPALSPTVGAMLEEAAAIYFKHAPPKKRQKVVDPQAKAIQAIEEGMAKMLELGKADTIQAQELELSCGWAEPLLSEMREVDRAIEQYRQVSAAQAVQSSDPLVHLREARQELQSIESAIIELEQR